jgi:hypothetical protein
VAVVLECFSFPFLWLFRNWLCSLCSYPFILLLPPLWSSGKSSWLQIQRSGFDSRCYQIFWEVVGLERGSLSLVAARSRKSRIWP